jgi:carboxymethylenebutenolidase
MTITDNEVADIPTPTGTMRTYVLKPAAPGKYPGIVLYSEIFQVTGPIRRTAAYLAGHGFVVAIPEVYHELMPGPGVVLAYDQAGADQGNAMKTGKTVATYDEDAAAAVNFLQQHPHCSGDVGTWGMCLGGHLAFRAACTNPAVKAATCFYATDIHKRSLGKGGDDTLDRINDLKAEMLMIWGRQDPHIPLEGRRIVYDALTAANIPFTWHEVTGQHAFIRDEGPRYDADLARQCMVLGIELMRRKLR